MDENYKRCRKLLREAQRWRSNPSEVRQALHKFEEAQNAAKRLQNADHRLAVMLTALGNIGVCHFFLGEHRKAVLFFQQALGTARHARDRSREVGTLRNLGKCHQALSDHAAAAKHFGEAATLARETGDAAGAAECFAALAECRAASAAATTAGGIVKNITDEREFDAFVTRSSTGRLVVVDYSATWCPPSRMMEPVLEQLSAENLTVDFVRVDADDDGDGASIVEGADIQAFPTFKFFRDGQVLASFSGADKEQLVNLVQRHKGPTAGPPAAPAPSAAGPQGRPAAGDASAFGGTGMPLGQEHAMLQAMYASAHKDPGMAEKMAQLGLSGNLATDAPVIAALASASGSALPPGFFDVLASMSAAAGGGGGAALGKPGSAFSEGPSISPEPDLSRFPPEVQAMMRQMGLTGNLAIDMPKIEALGLPDEMMAQLRSMAATAGYTGGGAAQGSSAGSPAAAPAPASRPTVLVGVRAINTRALFAAFVTRSTTGKLICVAFSRSSSCGAFRALGEPLERLAASFPDVVFVLVEGGQGESAAIHADCLGAAAAAADQDPGSALLPCFRLYLNGAEVALEDRPDARLESLVAKIKAHRPGAAPPAKSTAAPTPAPPAPSTAVPTPAPPVSPTAPVTPSIYDDDDMYDEGSDSGNGNGDDGEDYDNEPPVPVAVELPSEAGPGPPRDIKEDSGAAPQGAAPSASSAAHRVVDATTTAAAAAAQQQQQQQQQPSPGAFSSSSDVLLQSQHKQCYHEGGGEASDAPPLSAARRLVAAAVTTGATEAASTTAALVELLAGLERAVRAPADFAARRLRKDAGAGLALSSLDGGAAFLAEAGFVSFAGPQLAVPDDGLASLELAATSLREALQEAAVGLPPPPSASTPASAPATSTMSPAQGAAQAAADAGGAGGGDDEDDVDLYSKSSEEDNDDLYSDDDGGDGGDEPAASPLEAACARLAASAQASGQVKLLAKLAKALDKIVTAPGEPKYRRLKTTAELMVALQGLDGFAPFFTEAGFEVVKDCYAMPDDNVPGVRAVAEALRSAAAAVGAP